MQQFRVVLGLVLSCLVAGTAAANPSDGRTPVSILTLPEYARRVDLALRPMFSSLVTQWIKQRYGHDASARIRFISFEPNGFVHVHVGAEAPEKTCVFALYYGWKNGWKVAQVENHSGAASGCD